MAFSMFLHFLALLLYQVIAIRQQVQVVSKTMVKLNLAGMDSAAPGLEPTDSLPAHPPELPTTKMQAGNAVRSGNFPAGPVDEIFAAKPPVDIEFADVDTAKTISDTPVIAGVASDATTNSQHNYLELLQNTVQQKSSIPAEAAMNNISGKAPRASTRSWPTGTARSRKPPVTASVPTCRWPTSSPRHAAYSPSSHSST